MFLAAVKIYWVLSLPAYPCCAVLLKCSFCVFPASSLCNWFLPPTMWGSQYLLTVYRLFSSIKTGKKKITHQSLPLMDWFYFLFHWLNITSSKHLHFRSLKLSVSRNISDWQSLGKLEARQEGLELSRGPEGRLGWHFRGAVEFGQWGKHLWLSSWPFRGTKRWSAEIGRDLVLGCWWVWGLSFSCPPGHPNSISILWSSPQNPNLSHNPILPPSHPKCPEAYMWIVITIMVNVMKFLTSVHQWRLDYIQCSLDHAALKNNLKHAHTTMPGLYFQEY